MTKVGDTWREGVLVEEYKASARQEPPQFPPPQREHEWLHQLAGKWDTEGECSIDPTQPAATIKGLQVGRKIGEFWVTFEHTGECPATGAPFTGILNLGYDPERKKYVGNWFDSMTSYLWHYTGTVDPSGKTLTLDTEGPSCWEPGEIAQVRETIQLENKDYKIFTSSAKRNGEWVKIMTLHQRRRKK